MGPLPMFCRGKLTLMVSSGSAAALPGPQLSAVTAAGGTAPTTGVPPAKGQQR